MKEKNAFTIIDGEYQKFKINVQKKQNLNITVVLNKKNTVTHPIT